MKDFIRSVSIDYSDAKISFFKIYINKSSGDSSNPIWHRHNYYELHFSKGDVARYTFEDEVVELHAGEMMIISPGRAHKTLDIISGTKKPEVISMTITRSGEGDSFFEFFISALERANGKRFKIPNLSKELLSDFNRGELYENYLGICKLKASASELIYHLFSILATDKNAFLPRKGNNIFIMLDSLVNYPDITLEEMSEITNYSKRHISRLIVRYYGMSLTELRKKYKALKNK